MPESRERWRSFDEEIREWGPQGSRKACSLAEAESYCRKLATGHYENFPLVSLLLPKKLHQPFFNVYAFCRWSDDLGDEINDPTRSLQLLQWWREQMVLCHQMASSQELSGEISLAHPVMIALQKTIQEFGIPLQPFVDLISAFEQDQCQTRYETFEDLLNYCERSANPVGRLVLYLGRDVSEQNVFWSDAICTGLQLANFWQDVARDYQIGRIYLPVAEMKEFGVSEETIRERVSTEAFQKLMTFQVERTRFFFEKGKPLVNHVTNDLRLDVDLFIRGGECILDKIARINYRVLETRPKVTKWDGGRLLIMALGRSLRKRFWLISGKVSDICVISLKSTHPKKQAHNNRQRC